MVFRAFSTPFVWIQYKRGLSSLPVSSPAFQASVGRTELFLKRFPPRFLAAGTKTRVMLFEQKSRRKSSVEIRACPYNSLTTSYFLPRFPQRFLAVGNKTRSIRIIPLKISSMISSASYKTRVWTAFSGFAFFFSYMIMIGDRQIFFIFFCKYKMANYRL